MTKVSPEELVAMLPGCLARGAPRPFTFTYLLVLRPPGAGVLRLKGLQRPDDVPHAISGGPGASKNKYLNSVKIF